ncbi:MAG: hypothetical protein KIS92_17655 [Planctomycetota bacterium]|nr:hypothetical protein [Planctomycetota bacterium]
MNAPGPGAGESRIQFGYLHLLLLVVVLSAISWSVIAEYRDEPYRAVVYVEATDEATRKVLQTLAPEGRWRNYQGERGVTFSLLLVRTRDRDAVIEKLRDGLDASSTPSAAKVHWAGESFLFP